MAHAQEAIVHEGVRKQPLTRPLAIGHASSAFISNAIRPAGSPPASERSLLFPPGPGDGREAFSITMSARSVQPLERVTMLHRRGVERGV